MSCRHHFKFNDDWFCELTYYKYWSPEFQCNKYSWNPCWTPEDKTKCKCAKMKGSHNA